MRAAILTGPKTIEIQDRPKPSPGPGEILVQVAAVGLCGSDVHYFRGAEIGDVPIPYPYVLGHECTGIVAALGPDVSGPAVGTEAFLEPARFCGECEWCRGGRANLCTGLRFFGSPPTEGTLQEYYVVSREQIFPLPSGVTLDTGLLAEPLETAIHAVDLAGPVDGQTAAIIGAGPIGLCVLHILKRRRIKRVISTERLSYRVEAARRMGADEVIDASKTDSVEAVLELTGGRGADIVFEAAGTPEAFGESVRMACRGARLVWIGIPEEDEIRIPAQTARRRELQITLDRRSLHGAEAALEILAGEEFDPGILLTHTFPLAETEQAYGLVDGYRGGVIKAVVRVDR